MKLQSILKKLFVSSLIDNELLPKQGALDTLLSPVTKEPIAFVISATGDDVERAISSSCQAFKEWKRQSAYSKGAILRKMASLFYAQSDFLAELMALEMGKPIKEGKGEVAYAAEYFNWFAGESERVYGLTVPSRQGKKITLSYEPIGPAALITPWNFPLAMGARKIAAALASGSTALLKPSKECPLSGLAMGLIAKEAGLPPGCLNILIGDELMIGKVLLASPAIRKLSFTGSTEVGRYLYAHSAPTLKKLTLELGGHAPLIVFDDADIPKAAKMAAHAKLRNSGQTCVAASRFYIQEGVYEAFKRELVEQLKALKVGSPLDPDTDLSNVLHPSSVKKMRLHLEDALAKGAEVNGAHPAIVEQVNSSMLLCQEETFGPLFPLMKFKTDEEALQRANDTPYGLAAYVFTSSLKRAHRATESLDYGVIGLNEGAPSSPEVTFGGVKASGFGSEGGPTGIYEYLTQKCVIYSVYTEVTSV